MKKAVFLLILSLFCCRVPQQKIEPESFENLPKWIFMLYVNADNDLDPLYPYDLQEIKFALKSRDIEFLILADRQNAGANLVHLSLDDAYDVKIRYPSTTLNGHIFSASQQPELNMMDPANLTAFVNEGKKYQADRYALVLWSHSLGWRSTSRALTTDYSHPADEMLNEEIAAALDGTGLDMLVFDSCSQGSLELLWSVRQHNAASYVIASTYLVPGLGMDYYNFLLKFQDSARRIVDFSSAAVLSYKEAYEGEGTFSLYMYDVSALDLAQIDAFITYVNGNLAGEKANFEREIVQNPTADAADVYEFAKNSAYGSKTALLEMLNRVIVYGWDSRKGLNVKGVNAYSNYDFYLSDYFGIDTEYNSTNIPFVNDTDWETVLSGWDAL